MSRRHRAAQLDNAQAPSTHTDRGCQFPNRADGRFYGWPDVGTRWRCDCGTLWEVTVFPTSVLPKPYGVPVWQRVAETPPPRSTPDLFVRGAP